MAPSSKTEKKRCLYEVLELSRSCTTEEIRSAYRRLALQRHPDKLCRTGVPVAEATAGFQELLNAYEVLSDPKERLWYDTHLKQNLFSSKFAASHSSGSVPDLFSFFSNSAYSGYSDSGRGFYKVYADLFEKIYASELSFAKKSGLPLPDEPPVMGNLESPYEQVTAFYNHWLKFMTVLDFSFVDQCDPMAATNRKAMKRMDEDNKKARKKARREYSESVRGLANFVKKRDKRVIDMQFKRNAELERKREEEKQRKKELQRERAERARNYEAPEWAQVEDEDEEDEDEDEDEDFIKEEEERREFYCVVCSKKFKSDKQWSNHEQSKKHKEKVAELREAFSEEDKEYEASTTQQNNGEAGYDDEIVEDFEDNVGIQDDDIDDGKTESSKTNEFDNNNNNNGGEESDDADADAADDDEASILEAMLSGHKSRKNRHKSEVQVDIDSDELEFMEFNDTNGPRRNRGGRMRRSRRQEEGKEIKEEKEDLKEEKEDLKEEEKEEVKVEVNEEAAEDAIKVEMKERNDGETVKPRSRPVSGSKTKKSDKATERHHKHSQKAANKKSTTKKENAPNPKDAESKGRKQKMAGNDFANTCDKCGEQFKTRTKLHQHLGDTGHASLKSR